jgi:hypothetical protein
MRMFRTILSVQGLRHHSEGGTSARFVNVPSALEIGHLLQMGRIPQHTSISKALESFSFAKW